MSSREARASLLRQKGFPSPRPIRKKRTEHLSGKRNRQCYLWGVLTFRGGWSRPGEPGKPRSGIVREVCSDA